MIGGRCDAGRYDIILRNSLDGDVLYAWIGNENDSFSLWADRDRSHQWRRRDIPFVANSVASLVLGSSDLAKIPELIATERERYLEDFGVIPRKRVYITLKEESDFTALLRVVFT
jgi:hypothetical protein